MALTGEEQIILQVRCSPVVTHTPKLLVVRLLKIISDDETINH